MEIFINKSCLIKFKTELLSQTAVLIVHLLTHLANMGDLAVVELAVVKNKFNRLLAFDCNLPHGVIDYHNEEPRLTLISFIDKLSVDRYPIQNMKCTSK
jgi:hypothetical protein